MGSPIRLFVIYPFRFALVPPIAPLFSTLSLFSIPQLSLLFFRLVKPRWLLLSGVGRVSALVNVLVVNGADRTKARVIHARGLLTLFRV